MSGARALRVPGEAPAVGRVALVDLAEIPEPARRGRRPIEREREEARLLVLAAQLVGSSGKWGRRGHGRGRIAFALRHVGEVA